MSSNTPHSGFFHTLARQLHVRPRLLSAIFFGVIVWLIARESHALSAETAILLGWDTGVLVYLTLATHLMLNANPDQIRQRAEQQNDGEWVVLAFSMLSAGAVLIAIVSQLAGIAHLQGAWRYLHIALAALTMLLSWLFIHVSFSLQYAHDYFIDSYHGKNGGLEFPGTKHPDFSDFLYFSLIIGTSGQTGDVSITNRTMRKTALVQCVLAFFFNATIIALTINIAASLF